MFTADKLQRFILAGIGAIVLSSAFVGAAVAPAQANQSQACLLVSHA
jgi:hypothetical protein